MLLRDYLHQRHLTQTEFADLVGVSRPACSYWLSGRNRPSPASTKTIESVTRGDVTAADLQRGWEIEQ